MKMNLQVILVALSVVGSSCHRKSSDENQTTPPVLEESPSPEVPKSEEQKPNDEGTRTGEETNTNPQEVPPTDQVETPDPRLEGLKAFVEARYSQQSAEIKTVLVQVLDGLDKDYPGQDYSVFTDALDSKLVELRKAQMSEGELTVFAWIEEDFYDYSKLKQLELLDGFNLFVATSGGADGYSLESYLAFLSTVVVGNPY